MRARCCTTLTSRPGLQSLTLAVLIVLLLVGQMAGMSHAEPDCDEADCSLCLASATDDLHPVEIAAQNPPCCAQFAHPVQRSTPHPVCSTGQEPIRGPPAA